MYSQDNNSGSFFIAIIKKNEDFKIEEKKERYSVPLNKEKMKTIGEDLDEFMNFIGYDMNDKKGEEDNKIVNENQEIKEKFFETEVKDEDKDIDNNNDDKDNKNENNKKDDNDKNMKIIYFNLFHIELIINNKYKLIFLYILILILVIIIF